MLTLSVVFVLSVVCSAIAITLPNGFTFDERKYMNLDSRATNFLNQTCESQYEGCADDCATTLYCDGNYKVISSYPCYASSPYCVKGAGPYTMCSGNFPLDNPTCLNKALNSFICTEDGSFPDPTDCAKYHVCQGSSHSIVECASSKRYSYDPSIQDTYTNPGNGVFACYFKTDYELCSCERFMCDGMPNTFAFRYNDRFHYAYCLQIGSFKATVMFKCPAGTVHDNMVDSMTNTVQCLPVNAPIV